MESIAEDDDATSDDEAAPAASANDSDTTTETPKNSEQEDSRADTEADKNPASQAAETIEDNQETPVKYTDANDDLSSEEEPEPMREVDPKEWRKIHDEWLHAAMRAAMGNVNYHSRHRECGTY